LGKYSKIAYIALILIVLVSGFGIYKMINKERPQQDQKAKVLSEVKHLENKFADLFNQMNNISFENYKISSTDIKGKKSEEETQSSGQSGGQSGGSGSSGGNQGSEQGGGQSGGSGGSGSSSSQSSGQESSADTEQNKEYELESTGILTGDTQPNWEEIKNDVERIYTSLYPTTVDLYQIDVNQDDIVNFNKEYDNLTQAVKNESKEDALEELTLLYDYLPRFVEKCTDEEKEKIIVNTKNYVFKAYSILDQEEWATISENINNAVQEFTKLVTDINNKENGNQYNINKTYIIINELQNAVQLRDKEVFLIKYKNLLEEIENV